MVGRQPERSQCIGAPCIGAWGGRIIKVRRACVGIAGAGDDDVKKVEKSVPEQRANGGGAKCNGAARESVKIYRAVSRPHLPCAVGCSDIDFVASHRGVGEVYADAPCANNPLCLNGRSITVPQANHRAFISPLWEGGTRKAAACSERRNESSAAATTCRKLQAEVSGGLQR